MKNASPIVRKIIVSSIAVAIALSAWCLIFFLRQELNLLGASDACFITGAIELAAVAYLLIRRLGAFDIFEYSFYRLGESFKPGRDKRYETAYDFAKNRKEKRQFKKPFFWPFLIVGATLLIVALILMIVFENSIGA
ncbi:MAG: DUF3899 domain-containing protein [Bacilli bacterium]|nr:DUF3899 domain-containing protein [Bacilli bacterium]